MEQSIQPLEEPNEITRLRRAIVRCAIERHQEEWTRRALGEFSEDIGELLQSFDTARTQQIELLTQQLIETTLLLNVTVRSVPIAEGAYELGVSNE